MFKLIELITNCKKYFLPTKYDLSKKEKFDKEVLFYGKLINESDLCFDIGANIGAKSEIFLELGARIIAVEPQANCVEILRKKFKQRVEILNMGVGSKEGEFEFYISNHNQLSSFSKEWVEDFKENRSKDAIITDVKIIPLTTLDILINKYGKPKFIKIDVEGFELEVINGLSKDFNVLCFEYTVPERINELLEILDNLNSKFRHLEFNFSTVDNPYFELQEWVGFHNIIDIVKSESFLQMFAGDLYVRNKNFLS
jgi:FkbM family methyltransferase